MADGSAFTVIEKQTQFFSSELGPAVELFPPSPFLHREEESRHGKLIIYVIIFNIYTTLLCFPCTLAQSTVGTL